MHHLLISFNQSLVQCTKHYGNSLFLLLVSHIFEYFIYAGSVLYCEVHIIVDMTAHNNSVCNYSGYDFHISDFEF